MICFMYNYIEVTVGLLHNRVPLNPAISDAKTKLDSVMDSADSTIGERISYI